MSALRLIHGQKDRLRLESLEALDRRIHSLVMFDQAEREVARRVARWKRKRVWKTPLLWMVAGLAAALSWFGRTK